MAAAELHLLGQLSGASGFPLSSLFCKFAIESGSNFRVLQGAVEGQTQCDQPNVGLSPALPLRARCSHRVYMGQYPRLHDVTSSDLLVLAPLSMEE